jgi:ferredoxin-NADP reductase
MLWIFGLATDIALRAVPAPAPPVLGLAAGSGICPVLDPVEPPRRRLRVAGP